MITDSTLIQFRQMAGMLSDAHVRAEERAKATHERFNVFTTLLKSGDEVRLHTRFLHCLLDPGGSHDCGSKFLELFFVTLRESPGCDHSGGEISLNLPAEELRWTVSKEAFRTGFGQMDILMETSGYGIAIENKIWAREQENQVSSYAGYLKSRHGNNSLVIYLTLDGKQSCTADDGSYLRISYTNHILPWLEKCLRETYRIIPINQVLLQYREVVRQLTGRTLNAENMKPIIEFVRQNPDIIRFRSEIAIAAEKAVWETWELIQSGIIACLPEKWEPTIMGQIRQGGYSIIMQPSIDHALRNAPFEIVAERDENDFSIGIRTNKTDTQLSDEDRVLFEKMKPSMPMDSSSEWYHLGWINLIPGVDDAKFASVVCNPDIEGICRKVNDYLKRLEQAYVAATTGIPATSSSVSNETA